MAPSLRFFSRPRTLAAAVLIMAASAANAQVLIDETFAGDQAPSWSLLGTARLTAQTPPSTATGADNDALGSGWLELTPNAGSSVGAAAFNIPIGSEAGLDIEFDYAMYLSTSNGGSTSPWFGEGDGFTVFLINGTTAPSIGSGGATMGYRPMAGAYMALGFDRYGGGLGNNGFTDGANRLGMRGSASLTYPWLGDIPYGASLSAARATPKHVRITVSAAPNITLTVSIDSVQVWSKDLVINGVSVDSANNPTPALESVPASFKLGFSASTGGASQNHQIRNLKVSALVPIAAVGDGFTVNGPFAGNVGSNDQNPPSVAEYSLVSAPPSTEGDLVFNPDGSFVFTPTTNFAGTSFTYSLCAAPNGALPCSEAVATLSVAAAPSPAVSVPTITTWGFAALGLLLSALGLARRNDRT